RWIVGRRRSTATCGEHRRGSGPSCQRKQTPRCFGHESQVHSAPPLAEFCYSIVFCYSKWATQFVRLTRGLLPRRSGSAYARDRPAPSFWRRLPASSAFGDCQLGGESDERHGER